VLDCPSALGRRGDYGLRGAKPLLAATRARAQRAGRAEDRLGRHAAGWRGTVAILPGPTLADLAPGEGIGGGRDLTRRRSVGPSATGSSRDRSRPGWSARAHHCCRARRQGVHSVRIGGKATRVGRRRDRALAYRAGRASPRRGGVCTRACSALWYAMAGGGTALFRRWGMLVRAWRGRRMERCRAISISSRILMS
jgi:hypothetical protein